MKCELLIFFFLCFIFSEICLFGDFLKDVFLLCGHKSTHLSVSAALEWTYKQRPEEGMRSSGAGVTGRCKLCHVGTVI